MAVLWLGFMSLFLVALAIPVVQHFIYSTGRFGLVREIVQGFVTFFAEVLLFSAILGVVGYLAFGAGGALTMGLTGLIVSFVIVSILGVFSAVQQRNLTTPR